MPIPAWDVITLGFTSGIDTKQDPRALLAPKLLDLQNAIFTKGGQLRKRYGTKRLGTLDGPTSGRALMTRDDELLVLDGRSIKSYLPSSQSWEDRGPFYPLKASPQVVAKISGTSQVHQDRAELGGIVARVWESGASSYFQLTDLRTGAIITPSTVLSGGSIPSVRKIGDAIHLFYWHAGSRELRSKVIRPANLAYSLAASPITVVTDGRYTNLIAYDIAPLSNGQALLAYTREDGKYAIGVLKNTGSIEGSLGVFTPAEDLTCIACCECQTTSGPSYLVVSSGATNTYGQEFLASDMSVMADDIVGDSACRVACAAVTPLAVTDDGGITSTVTGTRVGYVWYELPATELVDHVVISNHWVTGQGPTSPTATIRHSTLASRGFSQGQDCFVVVSHQSPLQATYFIVRGQGITGTAGHDSPVIIARTLEGTAGNRVSSSFPSDVSTVLPQVELCSDGNYRSALGFKVRLDSDILPVAPLGVPTLTTPVYTEPGIAEVTLDFSVKPQSRQVGKSRYLTGGLLYQYDGLSAVENNFLVFPEGAEATEGSAGAMTAGTRAYRLYCGSVDAQGEREISTTFHAFQVTIAGSKKTTITIRTIAHTMKQNNRGNLFFVLTRTKATPFDTDPFFQVSSQDPNATGDNGWISNDPSQDYITFVDNMTDDDLGSRPLDPYNGGELENTAPESGSVLASGQDRLYQAGLQDPNKILYSKLHFGGSGVSWEESLQIQVDEEGGAVTGLALLNESIVIFKTSSIYHCEGDGRDNNGQGFPYSGVNLTSQDYGAIEGSPLVSTTQGIYFKSKKGIALLSGAGVQYIGAPVEAYNGQTVTAATLLPDQNQIRFLAQEGRTLVYDFFFNQWSTFTNYTGQDATIWQGQYCFLKDNGQVMVETPGVWTDAGAKITLLIETAWIKLADLQGFQQIKSAGILGEYRSPHKVRVSYQYDYETGFPFVYTWDPATTMNLSKYGQDAYGVETPYGGQGSTNYQYMHGLRRQTCESIRFRIEDINTTDPGEAFILTALSLEVRILGGLNRMGEYRNVGSSLSSKST